MEHRISVLCVLTFSSDGNANLYALQTCLEYALLSCLLSGGQVWLLYPSCVMAIELVILFLVTIGILGLEKNGLRMLPVALAANVPLFLISVTMDFL